MNFIGLDVHSATFTVAYVNGRGELGQVYQRPTSAHSLIDVVEQVRGPKHLVVEECHLAQWVKQTLERRVDKLIVCDPRRNDWIAKDEFANDTSSAFKLAKLLHGGFIKEIHHPDECGAELRGTFLHYFDLGRQIVRLKNKAKATFRRVAIRADASLYDPRKNEVWLEQLKPYRHLQNQARHVLDMLELAQMFKDEAHASMVKQARRVDAYPQLLGIPGVGEVIASGYIALIETPYRFSRRNKLWRYACLGNQYHESDHRVYTDRSSKSGNRVLKWLVMQHFQAAVIRSKQPNRFKQHYDALLSRGLGNKTARRHMCRSLLSTVRAIWMRKEAYRQNL